jgi:hypothetical protein
MRLAQTPDFEAYRSVPTLDVFATSDWQELALSLALQGWTQARCGTEGGRIGFVGERHGCELFDTVDSDSKSTLYG